VINVLGNQTDQRVESASSSRFFGKNNEAAQDCQENWRQSGQAEAPAARAGVISVLIGEQDPTNGRTMFEGSGLIESPLSNFKSKHIDTGVATEPLVIGGTTFYKESSN